MRLFYLIWIFVRALFVRLAYLAIKNLALRHPLAHADEDGHRQQTDKASSQPEEMPDPARAIALPISLFHLVSEVLEMPVISLRRSLAPRSLLPAPPVAVENHEDDSDPVCFYCGPSVCPSTISRSFR